MSTTPLVEPAAEAVLPEQPSVIEGEEIGAGETMSELTDKKKTCARRIRRSSNKSSTTIRHRSNSSSTQESMETLDSEEQAPAGPTEVEKGGTMTKRRFNPTAR